jgi:3',5'-cyclic AMP phosphodiesterase CpdA
MIGNDLEQLRVRWQSEERGVSSRRRTCFLLSTLSVVLVLAILLLAGCAHNHAVCDALPGWKFAVVSDTQGDNKEVPGKSCINDAVVAKIAENMAAEKPDFVLVSGDLVNGWFRNGGTDYSRQYLNWKAAMEPVYRAGIKVYPVRGNHDSGPERLALPPLPAHLEPPPGSIALLKGAYLKHFAEPHIPRNGPSGEEGLTYRFIHKNAFVIALDQFDEHQHRIDQAWLERQLSQGRKRHIFVFGHEPAFQVRHKDCLAFYPEHRDAFWNAVGEAGGRLYFCGHDHLYNRALIFDKAGNPVRQVVAGTGGGRLVAWSGVYPEDERVKGEYNNSDHHGYLLVTVEGTRVTVSWKALVVEKGIERFRVLDSFSYVAPVSLEGLPER